jgi:hypothetical protein
MDEWVILKKCVRCMQFLCRDFVVGKDLARRNIPRQSNGRAYDITFNMLSGYESQCL